MHAHDDRMDGDVWHLVRSLNMGFIGRTLIWAEAMLILAAVSFTWLLSVFSAHDEAIATWVAALGTGLMFALLLTFRLPKLRSGRFSNALAVAVGHIIIGAVLLGLGITFGEWGNLFRAYDDNSGRQLILGMFSPDRMGAPVILLSMIAAGMVPERGGRPPGTQTAPTDDHYQL